MWNLSLCSLNVLTKWLKRGAEIASTRLWGNFPSCFQLSVTVNRYVVGVNIQFMQGIHNYWEGREKKTWTWGGRKGILKGLVWWWSYQTEISLVLVTVIIFGDISPLIYELLSFALQDLPMQRNSFCKQFISVELLLEWYL